MLLVGCGGASGAAPSPLEAEGPAVQGRLGAEVRSWVVNDRPEALERALAELEAAQAELRGAGGDEPGTSAAREDPAVAVWRGAGLRVFRVRRAEVGRLQEKLSPQRGEIARSAIRAGERISTAPVAVQRQWLDQGSPWEVVARGVDRTAPSVVALHDARLALGPGALRLLARCWAIPVPGDEGAEVEVRVQMVPQLVDGRGPVRNELSAPTPTLVTEEGQVFRRLLLTAGVRDGEALVIVPDGAAGETGARAATTETARGGAAGAGAAPAVGQVRRDENDVSGATVMKGSGTGPGGEFGGGGGLGPEGPRAASLGMQMLSAHGGGGGARVVIAIVPSVPKANAGALEKTPAK
ncbi:hypothetical protein BH11PLA1_BH11PLA1_12070 [soil metagenome]